MPATLPQNDAGNRLLVLAERGVERLEGLGERLHALRALGHALAGAIEPIGQRRTLGGGALLTPLLHALREVLPRLLPGRRSRAQLLLDGRPQLELRSRRA